MAKSKIIKELVNNEVSLTIALRRLYVLANDIGNEEIKNWADKEMNGYNKEDTLPDYRTFNSCELIYSGINGRYQVTNQPLPRGFLTSQTINRISTHNITAPLSEIEEYSKSKNSLGKDRTDLAGEVEKNSDNGLTSVQCFQIQQIIPAAQFARITNAIYNVVLKSLIELEKVYGCLDELDIGSEKINKKDKDQLFESLNLIIGKQNIKMKNSNIGSGTNTSQKTTDVEISPQISVSTEKKGKGFFKRFFKR